MQEHGATRNTAYADEVNPGPVAELTVSSREMIPFTVRLSPIRTCPRISPATGSSIRFRRTFTPGHFHLGFKLGRYHLRVLLESLEEIGVDHVILNLKYGKRPAAEVIEELGPLLSPQDAQ